MKYVLNFSKTTITSFREQRRFYLKTSFVEKFPQELNWKALKFNIIGVFFSKCFIHLVCDRQWSASGQHQLFIYNFLLKLVQMWCVARWNRLVLGLNNFKFSQFVYRVKREKFRNKKTVNKIMQIYQQF